MRFKVSDTLKSNMADRRTSEAIHSTVTKAHTEISLAEKNLDPCLLEPKCGSQSAKGAASMIAFALGIGTS